MENNRSRLRRINHHDNNQFSNQSIMNAMEKFVDTVNDMDETILVPCRLLDLKVGDADDTTNSKYTLKVPGNNKSRSVREMMSSTDLYSLYTMIHSVKNELLWGKNTEANEVEIPKATVTSSKGHVRRPSNISMVSTNSTASISDTDSETGNENDSGIEGEFTTQPPDYSQHIAENFRRHLCGLYRTLEQMTEAATYLTDRYQNDIGGAV